MPWLQYEINHLQSRSFLSLLNTVCQLELQLNIFNMTLEIIMNEKTYNQIRHIHNSGPIFIKYHLASCFGGYNLSSHIIRSIRR